MTTGAIAWLWPLLGLAQAALLSWLLVHWLLRWRHAPIDHPNARSLHARPVPRGGGLGIVVVGLAAIPPLAWAGAWPGHAGIAVAALAAVATIGFIDDHRPLPAWQRLAVHAVAATALAWALLGPSNAGAAPGWVALLALALAWSINLHNFMDGIDGLLGLQAVWYGVALAVLLQDAGEFGVAWYLAMLVAATLAFLCFNLPRARVFLGDVASGFIGLVFALVAAQAVRDQQVAWPVPLILASAFLVDASATLLWRLLRGERVWQAHREHLYQRLVAAGWSHGRVDAAYLGWNLLIALPAMLLAQRLAGTANAAAIAAAVLVLALLVWLLARWRLDRAARGSAAVPP